MNVIRYIGCLLFIMMLNSCSNEEASTSQSESFIKLFGSSSVDRGLDIVQGSDASFYIVGTTTSIEEETDMFIVKTDNAGNQQWVQTFGDTLNDAATSVRFTSDENLIILGTYTTAATGSDIFLIKMDQNGDTLWTKTFESTGTQIGHCIQETADGGFIMVGRSIVGGEQEIVTVKTDENGEIGDNGWYISNGYSNTDEANLIIEKNYSAGYVIIGKTSLGQTSMTGRNILLISVTNNGSWSNKIFGGTGNDEGKSVIHLADNDYIVTGILNQGESSQVFLNRISLTGEEITVVWENSPDFQITGDVEGKSLCAVDGNSFVLLGKVQDASTSQLFLSKIDGDGTILWTRFYGEFDGQVNAFRVQKTYEGGFIIIGHSQLEENSMVTIIKTDSEGNI